MVYKFVIFSLILVFSVNYGRASFEPNNQIKENSEKYFTDGREAENESSYRFPEFEKISEFLEPLIKHAQNHRCRRQLETLVKSLRNSSLWAVQMFDASTKTPNGVLTSDAYELGNYDACVEINLKRAKDDNILGKYCLINFSMKKSNNAPLREDPHAEMQPWEKLMVPIFSYGFINNLYRSAVCVPNECLPQDVESIFRHLFNTTSEQLKRNVEINVPENACAIANTDEYRGMTYVKKITPVIFLWVAIVTIFELLGWFPKSKSTWRKIPLNFSAYKNYKILTCTKCLEPIPVINSLKVFGVVFLVITRRISLFLSGPIMNRRDVDEVFDESFKETFFAICSSTIADTFLTLDGFLHYYRVFYYYRKNSKLSIWRVYVFQFLNMCPMYVTAILFYGYVYEALGTGPMWKERTGKMVENCKENWAINLLNLNNFIKVNDMCIFESWYIAVVAQCFVMVPILAKITQKIPGKIVLKLLIAAVSVLPVVKFYYFPEWFGTFQNGNGDVYWHQKLSTKTLDRASAYVIGILSSMAYLEIREKKKISKSYDKISLCVAVLILGMYAHINFNKMSPLQKAYLFPSRQICWCLFISLIIIGVSTKSLAGIAPLLTGKYLFPLGRLSYSYLLILDLVQMYTVGIMRTLDYFSLSRMVWISSADLLATYVAAFVYYMIAHRPISNILHEVFIGV